MRCVVSLLLDLGLILLLKDFLLLLGKYFHKWTEGVGGNSKSVEGVSQDRRIFRANKLKDSKGNCLKRLKVLWDSDLLLRMFDDWHFPPIQSLPISKWNVPSTEKGKFGKVDQWRVTSFWHVRNSINLSTFNEVEWNTTELHVGEETKNFSSGLKFEKFQLTLLIFTSFKMQWTRNCLVFVFESRIYRKIFLIWESRIPRRMSTKWELFCQKWKSFNWNWNFRLFIFFKWSKISHFLSRRQKHRQKIQQYSEYILGKYFWKTRTWWQ